LQILYKKKYLVNGEYLSKGHAFDEDSDYESPEEEPVEVKGKKGGPN